MAKFHTVLKGDCINSIAFEHGHFPDNIWNHPENEVLRNNRPSSHVLNPGDTVYIPDIESKKVGVQVDARHRFRRKGVPKLLQLQFMDPDEPMADVPYVIVVDGKRTEGILDAEGWLREWISPAASRAVVTIDEIDEYVLDLARVDPAEEQQGFLDRLKALGYDLGREDDAAIAAAISGFQAEHQMDVTGVADDRLRDKLQEVLGC